MQLKIRRSQREGGVISKNAIFCLDARAEFTPEERQSITRYKLQNEVIYNSEASKRLLEKSAVQLDGSFRGNLKSLATVAFAATKLNITIGGLERGQHIECKSLEELLGAEEEIMTACQNLKGYLEAALTFDGREVLIDFDTGEHSIVARAVTPEPMLVAPALSYDPEPIPAELPPPMPEPPYEQSGKWTDALDSDAMAFVRRTWDTPSKRYAAIAGLVLLLFILVRACAR